MFHGVNMSNLNSEGALKTFYYYFRPFAILCKLLGILPLQNVHRRDTNLIVFRFFSISQIYSTIIFIGAFGTLNYYSGFMISDRFNPDCSLFGPMVVNLISIRSIICFACSNYYSRKLPRLIILLDKYDLKQTNKILCGSVKKFFKWTFFPFLFSLLLLLIAFTELYQLNYNTLPDTDEVDNNYYASLCFAFVGLWQIIPLLIYFYFAIKIKHEFSELNKLIITKGAVADYRKNFETTYDSDLAEFFKYIRYMYSLLSSAVNELSYCYGNFMAIDQLCITIMFVINIYVFVFCSNQDEHLLYCTFINAYVIFSVLFVSQGIKDEANKTLDLIKGIPFSAINDETGKEIQMLILHTAARPVEISAAGYFIMDRNQIPSILSSVATYLVVLIQFTSGMNLQPSTEGQKILNNVTNK